MISILFPLFFRRKHAAQVIHDRDVLEERRAHNKASVAAVFLAAYRTSVDMPDDSAEKAVENAAAYLSSYFKNP